MIAEANGPLVYDPLAPNDWQNPYPDYARLRAEAPVYYAEKTGVFCVSRYEDVSAVLRDPEVFSSEQAFQIMVTNRKIGAMDGVAIARFLLKARLNPFKLRKAGLGGMIITIDPPRHTELRALVNRAFTPKRMQALTPRLEQIVAECLEGCRSQRRFDLVSSLAIPLPVTVIAEMLGIDPSRHEQFKHWSDEIIAGASGNRAGGLSKMLRALGDLQHFLRGLVAERRVDPRDDIISVLADPQYEAIMSDAAVAQFVLLLLIAGNETTTNLIGNAVASLFAHPDQLELVQADPSLIPGLIEEVLRFEPPIHFVFRRATRDVEIAGARIPENAKVAALIASAHRDGARFEDPDRFDVTRDAKGHLGFGFGAHFCLGASLARLEAKVALEALIPELRRFKQTDRPLHYVDSFLVRGPDRLELEAA